MQSPDARIPCSSKMPFPPRKTSWTLGAVVLSGLAAASCQPTVKVEAPDKPIQINLNVKIEQEVRIKVERDVETLLSTNEDLF